MGSCDTFVVLPEVTPHGEIIFAKNSDRPANEIQEVVYHPATDHSDGDKLQCTYIEIDQASHTHAVVLSKPAWMWGAEMGANDQGVCIGNEAVWTKLNGSEDLDEKLLGTDLVRLGLERGDTAEDAMKKMTTLLETHGQGGRCYEDDSHKDISYHNSFLIADRKEAWVLETAGKFWAAEKVSGEIRNISNMLSIGTKIDAMASGLKENAKTTGLWDGSGDFDFSKVYAGDLPELFSSTSPANQLPCNRYKEGKRLLTEATENGVFDIKDMFKILRNEDSGICRSGNTVTTGSMVAVLTPSSSSGPCSFWFTGTPNPQYSVFKPFLFAPDLVFGSMTVSPEIPDDPAKTKPRFQTQVDRKHPLYKAHERGEYIMREVPGGNELKHILMELERQCIHDVCDFLQDFNDSKFCEITDLFKDVAESEIKLYK